MDTRGNVVHLRNSLVVVPKTHGALDKVLGAGREVLSGSKTENRQDQSQYIAHMMANFSCNYDRTAAIIAELHDTLLPILAPQAADQLMTLLNVLARSI